MSEKSLLLKVKEAAAHTIIYGLGSVLQTALGFILIPLYTRFYTTDIYGTFTIITLCGTLAGSVFYLGASSALSRSYFDYKDRKERRKVTSTSLFIILIGAFTQIILGYFFQEKLSLIIFHNNNYSLPIFLSLISSAMTFINGLFYVILRFERKSKQVVILNILSLIMSASLISSFLIIFKLGILAPFLGQVINQILLFCILYYLTRKVFIFEFSKHELRLQLKFGIPTLLTGLAYYLIMSQDRFILNKYCSLSDIGIYSLGFKIGSLINVLFVMPFGQIWAPMRMEYRNDENALKLYKVILTYYFIVGIFITAGASIFSKEILLLLSGHKEYIAAYKVIPPVMLSFLIYGTIGIIDNGIYFSRKMSYHMFIFWFCMLISLILNYSLIPIFGYMAAAYNILITFTLIIIIVFFVSNKLFKIPIEFIRLFKIFLITGFIVFLSFYLHSENIITLIFYKSFLMFLLVLIWYLIVMSKKEKEKIIFFITGRKKYENK